MLFYVPNLLAEKHIHSNAVACPGIVADRATCQGLFTSARHGRSLRENRGLKFPFALWRWHTERSLCFRRSERKHTILPSIGCLREGR